MMSLVRKLVSFLRRWLNDWDELAENKQLSEGVDFIESYDPLKLDKYRGNTPPYRTTPSVAFGKPYWGSKPRSAHLLSTKASNRWESNHMVVLFDLPGYDRWSAKGLKKLYVNKAIAQPLTEALRRCVLLQDVGHIPADWDLKVLQCFNPRRIGYNRYAKWSIHAYGGAVDINPSTNGRGSVGDLPRGVILAFKSCLFFHGADYNNVKSDPMHMEWVR